MTSKNDLVNLKKLYEKLTRIQDDLLDAYNKIDIEDTVLDISGISFRTGQAYALIDQIHTNLCDVTEELYDKIKD
jgi:hypothetical protein